MPIRVEKYKPEFRSAIRRICYVTGMMGEPIEYQWPDEESFADMFTLYYTDYEPQSSFVLVDEGEVVGYLNGCLDSNKAFNPMRIAGGHIIKRKLFLNPVIRGVLVRIFVEAAALALKGQLHTDIFKDDRWPAHLHINLLPQARKKGGGKMLFDAYFDYLTEQSIKGVYLETLNENTNAIGFFTAMGFRQIANPTPVPGWRDRSGNRVNNLVLVKDLA